MNRSFAVIFALGVLVGVVVGLLLLLNCQPERVENHDSSSSDDLADAHWWPGPALATPSATRVNATLSTHCSQCHDRDQPEAGIDLTNHDVPAVVRDRVVNAVRSGAMPPAGRSRPSADDLATLEAWDDATTDVTPPRRTTVRRLNRAEYTFTVRDLFGLDDLHPTDDFPADDTGHGFDNNADVQSLSPLLMEKYLAAAERVTDAVFRDPTARQRLLNPPAESPVPISLRKVTLPERDHVRERLVLSAADLPPPDPIEEEKQKAYAVLMAFADRAFRRPATHAEVNRLLLFVEESLRTGEGSEPGLRLAVQAVLCSSSFLFRVESSDDFALAARLSYFLWASGPDEELFTHAARGTLRQGTTLAKQVRRMLRDPKAERLAATFAPQWLQTAGLKDVIPDPEQHPTFGADLRAAMQKETELFFAAIVREDRGILDFIDADFTFVNERLARHYDIGGVKGNEFRRVSLAGTGRGGVVTQAAVLTTTSNPTRTSAVKRGRWVLENMLGVAPAAPPPGADQLSPAADGHPTTRRVRMERHRADPKCAACHALMDPLGFGLEGFDAIGAARARDEDGAINTAGTLPDGRTFDGPDDLRAVLRDRKREFARCLAEKVLTYALGRGLDRRDRPTVADITRKLMDNDYRFSALVLAVVHSDPFQAADRGGAK